MLPDETVIDLYHAHGESEQYHSEIKTDMDVERLPSGKFGSNKLVLELTMIAYNILRIIGQESLKKKDAPGRKKIHRRRIRTVISNLMQFRTSDRTCRPSGTVHWKGVIAGDLLSQASL